MNIEIVEEPIRFHLHGIGGVVENERYGESGFRLMNEMSLEIYGHHYDDPSKLETTILIGLRTKSV